MQENPLSAAAIVLSVVVFAAIIYAATTPTPDNGSSTATTTALEIQNAINSGSIQANNTASSPSEQSMQTTPTKSTHAPSPSPSSSGVSSQPQNITSNPTQQTPALATSDASGNLSSAFIATIEPNIVEINCYSYDNTIESSGSGVSYLSKSTNTHFIETNYHVYAGAIVNGQPPLCYAVFPEPPDFSYNGNYGDYQLTLYASHYNPSIYEDAAIFSLGAPVPSTVALDYIPVVNDITSKGLSRCQNSDVSVGDSITVFGYPNSGNLLGISETVTEGIVSGILPGPIYKTNAAIDHGNSGGVAILNKKSCALGIPTLGESGLTAGIGYIQSYALTAE